MGGLEAKISLIPRGYWFFKRQSPVQSKEFSKKFGLKIFGQFLVDFSIFFRKIFIAKKYLYLGIRGDIVHKIFQNSEIFDFFVRGDPYEIFGFWPPWDPKILKFQNPKMLKFFFALSIFAQKNSPR